MPLPIDFTGKTVMVSGGDRGIGAAIVEVFAKAGANVATLYRTGEAEANEHATKLTAEHKVTIRTYRCDIAKPAESYKAVSSVVKDFGRLDVVVCNAGVSKHIKAEDVSEEIVDWTLGVNLKGVFFMCQAAAKYWIAAKHPGSIVVNSSMSAHIVNVPQPHALYNASKAGVIMLTKCLAFEWAQHNIRVNAVSPGYVATHITDEGDAAMHKVWTDHTPMRRLGTGDEIANAVAFVASGLSTFTTGAELLVDGGYSLS